MVVVLITGCSSGIGLEAAVELALRGHTVVATMRQLSRATSLERAAGEAGVELEIAELDVTDDESVRRRVAAIDDRYGRLDVVVNNAGVNWVGPLELMNDEEAMELVQTNLMGPLRLSRAVLPLMRRQGSGRIVNVGSIAGDPRLGFRLVGMYVATKMALRGLTMELAKEVRQFGIDAVLLEGGIGGLTNMSTKMRDQAAGFAAGDNPYRELAKLSAFQAQTMVDTVPSAVGTATIIADACTARDPGLRYPRDGQAVSDCQAAITDDEFLELCDGSDPAPILQRHGIPRSYWTVRPDPAA